MKSLLARPIDRCRALLLGVGAFVLGAGVLATGSHAQGMMGGPEPAPARTNPVDINEVRTYVSFDQKLGGDVPLDLAFLDERGERVTLRQFFGAKPVLLTPVYYGCPMLCTQVLNGLVRTLRALNLEPGRDFEIVTYSINPTEGPGLAAEKRDKYLRSLDRPGAEAGWHFLSALPLPDGVPSLTEFGEPKGPGLDAIRELSSSIGFRYWFDRETGQYAHEPGFAVLTPGGKVSKYFFGLEYGARDLRFAVIESSEGKVGSVVDQILMLCFHYDPTTGTYGLMITRILRLVGAVFLLLLGGFIFLQLRRDRRTARLQTGSA